MQDRAQQRLAAEAVEKKNPLSPANRELKRQAVLAKLRSDRDVPAPTPRAQPSTPQKTDSGESSESAKPAAAEPSSTSSDQPAQPVEQISPQQMEWFRQQQAVKEAEAKVREASTALEKREAQAAAIEARADEKRKKMEMALANPAEFMAEVNMTQDEWQAFWANGGKLSPEQKRTREMEARLEALAATIEKSERRHAEELAASRRMAEESTFAASLKDYTFLPEVGGIDAVRGKQQAMQNQFKTAVTLKQAADQLEKEVQEGIGGMLKKQHILAKFGLADTSNQPQAEPAKPPRTLTARTAGDTTAKPRGPKGPLDWAGKRAAYLERLQSERNSAKSGR